MAAAGTSDPTSKPDALVRVAPDADFSASEITVQEGFVLSRVDGKSSVKTLCLLSGMGEDATRELLLSLWKKGLIVVGNRKAVVPGSALSSNQEPSSPPETPSQAESSDVIDAILKRHEEDPPFEAEIASEEVDIPVKARRRIRVLHKILDDVDLYQLLGLEPTSDLKEIRRAYFRRSKEFHPDRYFNRETGAYLDLLKEIFKRISGAYRILENDEHRARYLMRVAQAQQNMPILWPQKHNTPHGKESGPWKPKRGRGVEERKSSADMDQSTDGSTYTFVRRSRGTREKTTSSDKGSADQDDKKDQAPASETTTPEQSPEAGPRMITLDDPQPVMETEQEDPGQTPADETFNPEENSSRVTLDVGRDTARVNLGKLVQPRMAYERGLQLMEEGDMRGALASFRVAISFSPENAEYRKTYTEAVAHTRDNSAGAYFQRGQQEHAAGHLEVAYGLICKAASLDPRVQYLLKAAQIGHQMGDLLAAQVYAKRAVEKQPYSTDGHLMMAKILLASGRVEEAQQELELVLETAPGNAEARDLLEQLTGGKPKAR